MARRSLVLPTLLALLAAAASGWASLTGYAWTDYELANEGPFRAMAEGRWAEFFATAPVEGPSLLLRAPFALLPDLWGGGDLAIFRAVSVPGLLAGALLGVLLLALRRVAHPGAGWGVAVLLLAAAHPVTWAALEMGHPEEVVGGALCVAAVLAAVHGRTWLAAVLLGVALGNKAWAVLAIGPVLVALPGRRVAALALAGGIAAALVAPFVLLGEHPAGVTSAGNTYGVFQPWQLWWLLGEHDGTVVRGFFGAAKEGYRTAPGWIGPVTHPLIAALVVPATLAWWRVRGTRPAGHDALLLLALLLLARSALDAANNLYYHLPFVLALLAWEAVARARPPVFSLAAVAALHLTFNVAPLHLEPDAQHLVYAAWAVPALALLGTATFAPAALSSRLSSIALGTAKPSPSPLK